MAAERLSELGPLVVNSIRQVLCPIADIECGELVGGMVLIWLSKEGESVRHVDVAFAQVEVDEVAKGEYRRVDTVSLNQPEWQKRLTIEGQVLTAQGMSALSEILFEILPIGENVTIHTGETMRQRSSLLVPFAAFRNDLPHALPTVTVHQRTVRLFDFLVEASINDIVRFLHISYPEGVPRQAPVARAAAQVLGAYWPDPRALRRNAAGAYLSLSIREATETVSPSPHMFEVIDDLSRMRHEQAPSTGNLAFASARAAEQACSVRLRNDVLLWVSDTAQIGQPIVSELRIVRKLLHGTSPDWLLVISDGFPVGWAPRETLHQSPEAIVVTFRRPGKWQAKYLDNEFLAVIDGQVQRAGDVSPQILVDLGLAKVRELATDWDESYITKAASSVADADHGALLVFMPDAARYVQERDHSCIPVEPVRIEPSAVAAVAMMDGAMIFDTGGNCHAIAAILDGDSCGDERIDRGARYNAALRFCASNPAAICIVTSDDGLINVITGQD